MGRAWAGILAIATAVLTGCPARSGFDDASVQLGQGDTFDDADPDVGPSDDDLGDGDSAPADGDAAPGDSQQPVPPSFRFAYDRAWVILPLNVAMAPLAPGTGAVATYTVQPALPAGLVLDPTDGTISGTPSELVAPFTSYAITANDDVNTVITQILIGVIDSIVVDTTADLAPAGTLGDGVCAQPGECSIRAALAEADALAGTQGIIVPAGVYSIAGTPLSLAEDPLLGARAGGTTDVDASGLAVGAMTQAAGVTTYITDIELSGSLNNTPGGCIDASGVLFLEHVYIHDCTAPTGGGVNVRGLAALLQIEMSHFSDNHTTGSGAGIAVAEGAGLLVTTTTFNDNGAGDLGGAVAILNGSGIVARSYFGDNNAQNGAGAFYVAPSMSLQLFSSTLEGNQSIGSTGGALLSDGDLTASYNTFGSNLAARAGAVISVQGGTAHLRGNLMLAQPQPCDDDDLGFTSDGFNVFDGPLSACPDLSAGTDILDADLGSIDGSAADNGGPTITIAIDAGTDPVDVGDTQCPTVDQRGEPRPQTPDSGAATCDAGAFEVTPQTQ